MELLEADWWVGWGQRASFLHISESKVMAW